MSGVSLLEYIIKEFECDVDALDDFELLVAYMDYASYEGAAWFLLRHRETRQLYEAHGSHCSCYGFENQWKPEPTMLDYLQSERFSIYTVDGDDAKEAIRAYLRELKE